MDQALTGLKTYELIDSGDFNKLEQVGPYRISRPSPQAVWRPTLPPDEWKKVDAFFTRFSGGEGKWSIVNKRMEKSWNINVSGIIFRMELTDFGHLGIFAEQAANWLQLQEIIAKARTSRSTMSVLNLFAYTGGSTIAAALAGAQCVHVDASKTSVAWARENASLNGPGELPIRWILDDVQKFVAREVRRGSRYQGIILDPPSFGRGTKGESWKIEEHLNGLLDQLKEILAPDFAFILLSAHSHGYTPEGMKNLLLPIVGHARGRFSAGEMLIPELGNQRHLPSGTYCLFTRE